MCAGSQIGDDGAASLAPSLLRMTQLTSLELCGTLACIGICAEGVLANAGNTLMMLQAEMVARGAVAGGGGFDWRAEAAVRVDNQIGEDGAASLAPSLGRMTQLTSLDLGGAHVCIGGSCALRDCLRTPAVRE